MHRSPRYWFSNRKWELRVLWVFLVALPYAVISLPATAKDFAYVAHPETDTISVLDANDNTLVTTIRVGDGVRPSALALSPDGRFVYLANTSGSLWVIDAATHRALDTVPIGGEATDVAVHPNGAFVYVANRIPCSVSVVDTASRRVVNTIPVGYYPTRIVVSPDGASAFVATEESVVIIDTATNVVVKTVRTRSYPRLTMSPTGSALYAWGFGTDDVIVFDPATRQNLGPMRLPGAPGSISFARDGGRAYIVSQQLAVVDVNGRRVVGTIPVANARSVAVDPDGTRLYVARIDCSDLGCLGGTLVIVDAATGATIAAVGLVGRPGEVTLSPDGAFAVVTHPYDQAVSVVDVRAGHLVATLHPPGRPFSFRYDFGVAFTAAGAQFYLATDASLSVVDTATGSTVTLLTGSRPGRIAASRDGTRVYVTNALAGTLAVIDTASATVMGQIPVGTTPSDVVLSPDGDRAFVVNASAGSVSIVDVGANTVLDTISLSSDTFSVTPLRVATSPDGAKLYIAAWRDIRDDDDTRGVLVVVDVATRSVQTPIVLEYEGAVTGLAVDPDGAVVYFTHVPESQTGSTLAVFDTARSAVVTEVPVEGAPEDIVLTADGRLAYLPTRTFENGALIEIVDLGAKAVAGTIPLPWLPQAIGLSLDGTLLYVTSSAAKRLTVVDTTEKRIVATVPLRDAASSIAFVARRPNPLPAPSSTPVFPPSGVKPPRAYVVHWSGGVSVIDGTHVASTIPVAGYLSDIVASPDGKRIYVAASPCDPSLCEEGALAVIDPIANAVVRTISLGGTPQAVAVDPTGARAYVTLFPSGAVAVVDTAAESVSHTISVSPGAHGIAVAPDGQHVYVVGGSTVTFIDATTNTVAGTTSVGGYPASIAVSPDGAFVYVAPADPTNKQRSQIAVLDADTRALASSIAFPGSVSGLAASPDASAVYATAAASCLQYVAAVDTATNAVRVNIPVDPGPYRVAVTSDGAFVYVLNSSATVSVVDTSRDAVVASIPLPGGPVALALMPDDAATPRPMPTRRPTRTPTPSPTSTPTPSPAARVHVGSATGRAGDRLTIAVSLETMGFDVAAVQADLSFDPHTRIRDCAVNPTLGKNLTSFKFGFTWLRGIVLGDNVAPIPDGSVLYTCQVDIDPGTLSSNYSLMPSRVIASDPHGNRLPATGVSGQVEVLPRSPTTAPTRTAMLAGTPTPTPPRPVTVAVSATTGGPSDDVTFGVTLYTGGIAVAAVQNDIIFDPTVVSVAANADGTPACAVNPDISKGATRFSFLPVACVPGVSCRGVRALVIALDNLDPIPDGAELYACTVHIGDHTPPGTYWLTPTGMVASDPGGVALPAGGTPGEVTVLTPPGATPIPTYTRAVDVRQPPGVVSGTSPRGGDQAAGGTSEARSGPATGDGCTLVPAGPRNTPGAHTWLVSAALLVLARSRRPRRPVQRRERTETSDR